jgi:SpoVK/Ycf46/Vps4 family AAA+-type ATPase
MSRRSPKKNEPLSPLGVEISAHVRARFPLLYLVTWEEERALRDLEAVAISLRKMLLVWTETQGLTNVAVPNEPPERRLKEPDAVLDHIAAADKDAIYVLLDFHAHVETAKVRRRLRDLGRLLETSPKTVAIVAPRLVLPPELSKEITVLDVPLPTRAELEQHLDALVARLDEQNRANVDLGKREREELVRSAQGMTLKELEQTLALALVERGRIDRETNAIVLKEKEQIVRKSTVLEYVRWEQGLEDLGGLDLLKEFLESRREAFTERARDFGLPPPKGICLIGVQGCGKSLAAKAVSRFYRLPLLRMDMGRVFAGLVGRSEENIRGALKLAESVAPCVLWIDELEKAFSGTGSSNVSDAGTTARVISHVTTWLQERSSEVYVVATANDISQLPPELVRKGRFDEVFFVDLPAPREREEIFRIHLKKRGRVPDEFDLPVLSELARGFSGAEIEEAVNSGLYEAFAGKRPLETRDIAKSIERTVPLSETMHERVAGLRSWAEGRARKASSAVDLGLAAEAPRRRKAT